MLGTIGAMQCAVTPKIINFSNQSSHAKPVVSSFGSSSRASAISIKPRSSKPFAASSTGESATERFFQEGAEGTAREQLFSTISPVYDELNDQLSFGMHKVWKRMTVKWSGAAPGCSALDVCCGSGDIAMILAEVVGRNGNVVGLDFSGPMLDDAAAREASKRNSTGGAAMPAVQWIQGDAMDLPFEEGTFDAVTMGYGLRNVADIPKTLRELHRVLRPGCRAAILDFNNSENGLVDGAQEWFLENLVVPAADAKGVGDEYRYLRPSIKNFPQGKEQERLALEAGFSKAKHFEIGFGLMGVLVVAKAM
jgi:ubiquinone/menaquinone biosynthesis methyltransferase